MFTFTASTSQISHLADIFLAISSINNHALMIISPRGITLYAELNHIANALLTIDPALFSTYNFYSEDTSNNTQHEPNVKEELTLGVDIKLISDSFGNVPSQSSSAAQREGSISSAKSNSVTNMSNTNSSSHANSGMVCYLTYNGEGFPLIIEFEDSMISEKIEFLTFYTDLQYPYAEDEDSENPENSLTINHLEVQFELILKCDVLSTLLRDLQRINTTELYLYVSNQIKTLGRKSQFGGGPQIVDNQVNFISKGPIGLLKLIFPNEKTILEKIEIFGRSSSGDSNTMTPINSSIISVYNFNHFNKIFRSVKLSTKCKISKDLGGTLSVQLLSKNLRLPNYSGTLITFNMLALSSTDEGEHMLVNLNNVFDKDSYEYIRDFGKTDLGNASERVDPSATKRQRLNLDEYERIDLQIDRTRDEDEGRESEPESGPRGLIEIPLFL